MNIFYFILYKLITGTELDFSLNSPPLYINSPLAIMSILQFYLHAVWLDRPGSLCDHITSKYKQLELQMRNIFFIEPINSSINEIKAIESQAIARCCRIGQLNKVKLIRILIKDTIEEEIYNTYYIPNNN